ncbi:MAG: hypothetical protein J6S95_04660 [Lachnospiraceae bacterium]|nr:hypothetical protein [Lachnospiraceae bacterium]MBO7600424.1 hypothetical protein [Lachnospiraceae bacterium]
MANYFYDVETFISGTRKTEYLPKWAMDETIYNCDNTWKKFQKGFFLKYIHALLG